MNERFAGGVKRQITSNELGSYRVHLHVTAEIDVDMLHFIVGVGCPRGVSRIQGGVDEIV